MNALAWFALGYCACGSTVALLIGAAMRHADELDAHRQPAGVRDPETMQLWDENGRLDVTA